MARKKRSNPVKDENNTFLTMMGGSNSSESQETIKQNEVTPTAHAFVDESLDNYGKNKSEGQRWPENEMYRTHAVPVRYAKDGYVSLLTFSKEGKMKTVLDSKNKKLNKKKLARKTTPIWTSIYVNQYSEDLKEGQKPKVEFYFDDEILKGLFEKRISKLEKQGKKKFNKLKKEAKKELRKSRKTSDSDTVDLLALDKNYNSYIPDIGYDEFRKGFGAFLKGAAKGALVGLTIGAGVKLFSNLISKYAVMNNSVDNLNYSTNSGLFSSITGELNGSQTLLGEIKGILDPLKEQVATVYSNIGGAITDIGNAVIELDAVQSGIDGLKTLATNMGVDVDAIGASLTDGFDYVSDFLGYSTDLDAVATDLEAQGASEMASATESFDVTLGTETFDLGNLDIDTNSELDLFQSGFQGDADLVHYLVENGTYTDQEAKLIADAYEKRTLLYQAGQQKLSAGATLRTISGNITSTANDLNTSLTSIQSSSGSLEANIDSMNTSLTSLEGNVAGASGYLTSAQTTLDGAKTTIGGFTDSLNSVSAKVNSIETSLDNIYSGGVLSESEGYLGAILTNEVNLQTSVKDVVKTFGSAALLTSEILLTLAGSYVLTPPVMAGIMGSVHGATSYAKENKMKKTMDKPIISPEIALHRANVSYNVQ